VAAELSTAGRAVARKIARRGEPEEMSRWLTVTVNAPPDKMAAPLTAWPGKGTTAGRAAGAAEI
jgi:hypothetical protein